jgi:hypothetical protein
VHEIEKPIFSFSTLELFSAFTSPTNSRAAKYIKNHYSNFGDLNFSPKLNLQSLERAKREFYDAITSISNHSLKVWNILRYSRKKSIYIKKAIEIKLDKCRVLLSS